VYLTFFKSQKYAKYTCYHFLHLQHHSEVEIMDASGDEWWHLKIVGSNDILSNSYTIATPCSQPINENNIQRFS